MLKRVTTKLMRRAAPSSEPSKPNLSARKSAVTPSEKAALEAKYGKYAIYFVPETTITEKYRDSHDKHRQVVAFENHTKFFPRLADESFIAPTATVVGSVETWDRSSIWYNVVIRGDKNLVRIGQNTNIQDRTVISEAFEPLGADHDGSTIIGHFVTIGHGCQLRACTIEDNCLIGMNSIIPEGAYIEKNAMLGAGTVLSPGQRIPSGELWAGNPAKFIRYLTHEEEDNIVTLAENYWRTALEHKEEFSLPVGTAWNEAERLGINVGFRL